MTDAKDIDALAPEPGAPVHPEGPIEHVSFDIDHTLVATFDAWGEAAADALRAAAASRAEARGLDPDAFFGAMIAEYNAIREAEADDPGGWRIFSWYSNFGALLEKLPSLQPQNAAESERFAELDAEIVASYNRNRKNKVAPYAGVKETIEALAAQGVAVSLFSRARFSDAAVLLAQIGVDPALYAGLHVVSDQAAAPPIRLNDGFSQFREALREKAVYHDGDKTAAGALQAVADHAGSAIGRTLHVGDNKEDGITALNAGAPFAFAAYGDPGGQAKALNQDLLSDPYKLGIGGAIDGLKQAGAWPPTYTLDSPLQLLSLDYAPLLAPAGPAPRARRAAKPAAAPSPA